MEQQLKYVLNLIVSPQKKSTALAYIFNNRFHKINSSHDCKHNTQDGSVGFHQGCIVAYVDTIVGDICHKIPMPREEDMAKEPFLYPGLSKTFRSQW